MKVIILLSCFLLVFSCKRDEQLDRVVGCVEWELFPADRHSIEADKVAAVQSLMTANKIDYSNLRFYGYEEAYVQTSFPPYESYNRQIVHADLYANGLRIFSRQAIFHFKDGKMSYSGGFPIRSVNVSTKPKLSSGKVRSLFLEAATNYSHTTNAVEKECLKVELGYYDFNGSFSQEGVGRAWKVGISGSEDSEVPFAYFSDATGELIYFDDGIRTLN